MPIPEQVLDPDDRLRNVTDLALVISTLASLKPLPMVDSDDVDWSIECVAEAVCSTFRGGTPATSWLPPIAVALEEWKTWFEDQPRTNAAVQYIESTSAAIGAIEKVSAHPDGVEHLEPSPHEGYVTDLSFVVGVLDSLRPIPAVDDTELEATNQIVVTALECSCSAGELDVSQFETVIAQLHTWRDMLEASGSEAAQRYLPSIGDAVNRLERTRSGLHDLTRTI